MVLLLNTFSSQIMGSLAVPLLFLMRFTAKKQQKENERKGEVEILENVFESRLHLFKIMIFHSAALMLKVSLNSACKYIFKVNSKNTKNKSSAIKVNNKYTRATLIGLALLSL